MAFLAGIGNFGLPGMVTQTPPTPATPPNRNSTEHRTAHLNRPCGECGNPTGPAHKCPGCQANMHGFCGRAMGEQRHGQPRMCSGCYKASCAPRRPTTATPVIISPAPTLAAPTPARRQASNPPAPTPARRKVSRKKAAPPAKKKKARRPVALQLPELHWQEWLQKLTYQS